MTDEQINLPPLPLAEHDWNTYLVKYSDRQILNYARAAILADRAARAAAPVCPECKGTGMRDSGGVHPWGEAIFVPCDCEAAPAEPVAWMMTPNEKSHPRLTRDVQFDKPVAREDWTLTPLYASPPRSAEWVAEAMRLADEYANRCVDVFNGARPIDRSKYRAALEAWLKGEK